MDPPQAPQGTWCVLEIAAKLMESNLYWWVENVTIILLFSALVITAVKEVVISFTLSTQVFLSCDYILSWSQIYLNFELAKMSIL